MKISVIIAILFMVSCSTMKSRKPASIILDEATLEKNRQKLYQMIQKDREIEQFNSDKINKIIKSTEYYIQFDVLADAFDRGIYNPNILKELLRVRTEYTFRIYNENKEKLFKFDEKYIIQGIKLLTSGNDYLETYFFHSHVEYLEKGLTENVDMAHYILSNFPANDMNSNRVINAALKLIDVARKFDDKLWQQFSSVVYKAKSIHEVEFALFLLIEMDKNLLSPRLFKMANTLKDEAAMFMAIDYLRGAKRLKKEPSLEVISLINNLDVQDRIDQSRYLEGFFYKSLNEHENLDEVIKPDFEKFTLNFKKILRNSKSLHRDAAHAQHHYLSEVATNGDNVDPNMLKLVKEIKNPFQKYFFRNVSLKHEHSKKSASISDADLIRYTKLMKLIDDDDSAYMGKLALQGKLDLDDLIETQDFDYKYEAMVKRKAEKLGIKVDNINFSNEHLELDLLKILDNIEAGQERFSRSHRDLVNHYIFKASIATSQSESAYYNRVAKAASKIRQSQVSTHFLSNTDFVDRTLKAAYRDSLYQGRLFERMVDSNASFKEAEGVAQALINPHHSTREETAKYVLTVINDGMLKRDFHEDRVQDVMQYSNYLELRGVLHPRDTRLIREYPELFYAKISPDDLVSGEQYHYFRPRLIEQFARMSDDRRELVSKALKLGANLDATIFWVQNMNPDATSYFNDNLSDILKFAHKRYRRVASGYYIGEVHKFSDMARKNASPSFMKMLDSMVRTYDDNYEKIYNGDWKLEKIKPSVRSCMNFLRTFYK